MSQTMYTPPNSAFSNEELNALGSQYANLFGHSTNNLVELITRSLIYDTAPQQFLDLKLLNMKPPEMVNSDEFEYHEMGYGRQAAVVGAAGAAGVSYPTTQTVPVVDTDAVAVDTIVAYPNNTKGTVVAIGSGQIDVKPMVGGTLPAVSQDDLLTNSSGVEGDAKASISQYFRQGTIARYNYVQMLVKAMRFGKMEIFKYKNAGRHSNYLTLQRMKFLEQFRIDLSNILWNGERGEIILADGGKAKTAGGIYPFMVGAGSPHSTAGSSVLDGALEELALNTEFGAYGQVRFLYGAPRHILALSKLYKDEKTRYTPNDMIAKLGLSGVDIGSSYIVFVPFKRFEDQASFPASFANKLILLDQDSVTAKQTWGEELGSTLDRTDKGTLQTYADEWISGTFSIEFVNPLASGYIDIS